MQSRIVRFGVAGTGFSSKLPSPHNPFNYHPVIIQIFLNRITIPTIIAIAMITMAYSVAPGSFS